MDDTKDEQIQAYIRPLKRSILIALSILLFAFLFSCEKEDTQTTMPPSEDLIEKSSSLANLIVDAGQKNIEGIGCVQFQYPISFSRYDIEFQILNTASVQTDRQLVDFLNTLRESLLVSLNFPVQLIINEQLLAINSNAEFINTLTNAPEDCTTEPDCTLDGLKGSFTECPMYMTSFNDTRLYIDHKITFKVSNEFIVTVSDEILYSGTYAIAKNTNNKYLLTLETDWDNINGDWEILDCENFSNHQLGNEQKTMKLQGCNFTPAPGPFACFFDSRNEICDIDSNGTEAFDLTTIYDNCTDVEASITYHTTETEARSNTNAIPSPENFLITNTRNIYSRISIIDGELTRFDLYKIILNLIDCQTTDNCTTESVASTFSECPMKIKSYNNDTNTYSAYRLEFNLENSQVVISVDNEELTRGEFTILKRDNTTFAIEINANLEDFDGIWNIDQCDNFEVKNLTRNNDVMSIEPNCN